MKKEFVPYEESLELRELGFDEPCFGYYDIKNNNLKLFSNELVDASCNSDLKYDDFKHCTAPLYQQAFRWFREKHQLEGEVHCIRFNSKRLKGYQYAITFKNYQSFEQLGDYYAYEEAELECLKKLIKIVKNLK